MSDIILGRLNKFDLRTVWNNEATDFTPWLAEEENLKLLGDTLGLELELFAQEQAVGPFRADILCKDTVNDNWVLIENQLDVTNHTHLGQLFTYAAGLDAVVIVWVARRFTDEHRAALDWLNDITDESANFFGLEIELWKIGNSAVAPKFNVVSQPNDWIKATGGRWPHSDLTETQKLQFDYWRGFVDHLREENSFLKSASPRPVHHLGFAIGRSYFHLLAFVNTREPKIGVWLNMGGPNAKAYFQLLFQQREAIEDEIGSELDWELKSEGIESSVYLRHQDFTPLKREQWPEQWTWLRKYLEAFHKAFSHRIRALDAADYLPEDEEVEL